MTPTEQRAVERACAWVGWHYTSGIIHAMPGDLNSHRSINDLAEAVRVKCNSEEGQVIFDAETGDWGYCLEKWGEYGPLAFIVAVWDTEVMEG